MKLEVSEVFSVAGPGLTKSFGTLAEAMAAIQENDKAGSYTISESTKVLAAGVGITPGQPVTGQPAAKPAGAAAK